MRPCWIRWTTLCSDMFYIYFNYILDYISFVRRSQSISCVTIHGQRLLLFFWIFCEFDLSCWFPLSNQYFAISLNSMWTLGSMRRKESFKWKREHAFLIPRVQGCGQNLDKEVKSQIQVHNCRFAWVKISSMIKSGLKRYLNAERVTWKTIPWEQISVLAAKFKY